MLDFADDLGNTAPHNADSNRRPNKRKSETPSHRARLKTNRTRNVDKKTLAERQLDQPGYDEDFQ